MSRGKWVTATPPRDCILRSFYTHLYNRSLRTGLAVVSSHAANVNLPVAPIHPRCRSRPQHLVRSGKKSQPKNLTGVTGKPLDQDASAERVRNQSLMHYKIWRSHRDKRLHVLCAEGAEAYTALSAAVRGTVAWMRRFGGCHRSTSLAFRGMLSQQDCAAVDTPRSYSSCRANKRTRSLNHSISVGQNNPTSFRSLGTPMCLVRCRW